MTKRTQKLQHIDFVQFQSALNFIIFLLVLALSTTIKTSFVPKDFCLVMHIILSKKITTEVILHIRLVVESLNDSCPNIITNEDLLIISVFLINSLRDQLPE